MDAQHRKIASGALVAFLVASAFAVFPTAAAANPSVVFDHGDGGYETGKLEYNVTVDLYITNITVTGYGGAQDAAQVELFKPDGTPVTTKLTYAKDGKKEAKFSGLTPKVVGDWYYVVEDSAGTGIDYDGDGAADQFPITVSARSDLKVTLSSGSTTFSGDSLTEVTATVTDKQSGDAVEGVDVSFGSLGAPVSPQTTDAEGKVTFAINFNTVGGAGDYKVEATYDEDGDNTPELNGSSMYTVKPATLHLEKKTGKAIRDFTDDIVYYLAYSQDDDQNPLAASEGHTSTVTLWKGDSVDSTATVTVANDGNITLDRKWESGTYNLSVEVDSVDGTAGPETNEPEYVYEQKFAPQAPEDVTLSVSPEEIDEVEERAGGNLQTETITVTVYGKAEDRHPNYDGSNDEDDDGVVTAAEAAVDDGFDVDEDVTVTGDFIGTPNLAYDAPTGVITITGITPSQGDGEIVVNVNWNGGDTATIPISDGSVISASASSVTVDTPTKVQYTVTDIYGNPVPTARVTLFWATGANQGQNISQIKGNGAPGKGQGGVYEFTVNASEVEDIYVQATIGTDASEYNHSYAKLQVLAAHDMAVTVDPGHINAGDNADVTFNVTQAGEPQNADVYLLSEDEYETFVEDNTLPTNPEIEAANVDGSDGNYSASFALAAGTYYVYVVTEDGEHDNGEDIVEFEVNPLHLTAEPDVLVKGVDTNRTVVFHVTDHHDEHWNGTLAIYSEDGNLTFGNSSHTGGSITLADGTSLTANATVEVENGMVTLDQLNASKVGDVEFYFKPDGTGAQWAALDGGLTVSAPTITVAPDNIYVGQANQITVTVTHPASGEPLADQTVTIPDYGVEAKTGSNGKATIGVNPAASSPVKVYVNGDEAGSFTPVLGLAISFDENEYVEGDKVTVKVTPRGADGAESGVTITVDGTEIGTTGLDGTLTFDAPAVGTHELEASKEGFAVAKKSFTVSEKPAPPPEQKAEFEYSDLAFSAESFEVGKPVTVSAKVTNVGNAAGEASVELRVNDIVQESYKVSLEPGETKTVGFTWTPTSADSLSVGVNGLSKDIDVAELQDTNPGDTIPGFTGFAALAAMGAALVLLRRRD